MTNKKYKPNKRNRYDRHSIISIQSCLNILLPETQPLVMATIHGVTVKISSARHEVFKRSLSCSACGLNASFFAIERPRIKKNVPLHTMERTYHFNLYGIDELGHEVLFTKDHTIPRSKGGANHIDNYTTMCTHCNAKKGNTLTP